MDSERLKQIEEIYHAVLEIEPDKRESFFNENCGADEELRREVESLLAFEISGEKFLSTPPEDLAAAMFSEQQTNLVGLEIGRYRVKKLIGAGGMGEVYLAEDTRLHRQVALKVLHENIATDAERLRRFEQEARAASALNHPNILTVHEIGENGDSNYIVTEFIEGRTLRENLLPKKTNSLNQILKIGVQVAEALSAAHQAGIIHRDIKPENIMIRADGYAKVLDFGLAKLTEQKPKDDILSEDTTKGLVKTNPGMVMGTVSYMSPEQARGKETDARTDIWSLGVVLYEMLAGKVPFTGETINHTIVSILEKEPKLLENVPDELQRIVRKTLTKEVEMRYQTARDLLIDLKNLRRNLDIQGELERSIVPNREITTNQVRENETQIYTEKSIEETKAEDAKKTQNVTTSSSLEYAVIQAKSHKFATAIVGIILLGVISAVAYFGFFAKSNAKQIESIAVMPFVNESGNQDVEYLSDGMTETLIGSLSQVPNLNVKARSSVFRYKGKETDAQTIAKELNVQAVLNGRVVQRGDQLTLSLELVDAATENVIWSQQYNRKQSDLVTLQTEIARDVSSKLKSKLSGADVAKVEKTYTTNPEAYQLYLKGNFYRTKYTEEGYKKGVEYYEQAIALDPNYALAYTGIAYAYITSSEWYLPLTEAMPKAKAAALKAVELDNTLAEPYAMLANVAFFYEFNWAETERLSKRAIELDPNYSNGHHFYSIYLVGMRRKDEAVKEVKIAQTLEPFDLQINATAITIYLYANRYDDSIAQARKTLEIDPNFWQAYAFLGLAFERKKQFPEAIAALEKARSLDDNPAITGYLGYVYAAAGRKDDARRLLGELEEFSKKHFSSPLYFAYIYAGLNEKDKALESLEKAYEQKNDISHLNVDPIFDNLKQDPRFKDLLKRMNLPE